MDEEIPGKAQRRPFQRQLASDGRQSLEKSKASLMRRIQEHQRKLEAIRSIGGYASSAEREIGNFQAQIAARLTKY